MTKKQRKVEKARRAKVRWQKEHMQKLRQKADSSDVTSEGKRKLAGGG